MTNETPKVPDDASPIYEDLFDRDSQRKRAIDIARQLADQAREAGDASSEGFYKELADTMSDIRFDLHKFFPEVFDEQ